MESTSQSAPWNHKNFNSPEQAAEAFALQCQKEPNNPDAFWGMGAALESANELDGAFRAFQHARRLCPDHLKATRAGCFLLLRFNRQAELRLWIQTSPLLQSNTELQSIYAEACFNCGDYAECIQFLNQRPELLRRNPRTAAVRVRAMVYDPAVSAQTLHDAAKQWATMHHAIDESLPARTDSMEPDRRLRVGFVGPRMHLHNSSTHLLNLLHHIDRSQFETLIYSDSAPSDSRTEELRAAADHWHTIHKMSEREAAKKIRADRVDILIDPHQFSNDARLQIFAYRPAPVQIHWYANETTGGMNAVGFRIGSPFSDPPENDRYSSETLLRVPCYYLYSPSPMAQKTALQTVSPVEENGFITFGAIHHLAKYNDEVLAVWREIMKRVPNSRLLLGRNDLQSSAAQNMFREHLKQNGIDLQRVDLETDPHRIASLEIFNRIDITLDSFPFNGVATTSDTLWMGVPLITRLGDRTSGRRAADQLHLVGRQEWIAESKDEYVEKAVALAQSPETLAATRKTLHAEFAASPICDHARTAADLCAVLRRVWRTVCEKE